MKQDLRQTFFMEMGKLFYDARNYLDEALEVFQLTRPEWLVLALLRTHSQGISQSFARSYVGVEVSYFSKVLNRLEDKQLIIKSIDPNDKRNRIIQTNPNSSETLNQIFTIIHDLNETILADLSDQEIQGMCQSFNKVERRLKALLLTN